MAITQLTPDLAFLQGREGNYVFKHYRNKIVVTRIPRFRSWSREQVQGRKRFAEASTWAARVQRDPGLRESYAAWARKSDLTVRSAAISDFLNPGGLREIFVNRFAFPSGNSICVEAARKFQVVEVTVIVRDAHGAVLEQGPARPSGSDSWSYSAARDLRVSGKLQIEAIGVDRLGRQSSVQATTG